jgi:hypothetical protein
MVLAPGGLRVWLAIGHSIRVLDLGTGVLAELANADVPISRMAYREATRQMGTASTQGVASLWDTERWVCLASYFGDAEMTACAVSPDGDRIVVGDVLGRVHLLEPRFGSAR